MAELRIIIEPSSLEARENGAVTGQIWLELDGRPFPESRWNDFALVILGWWCRNIADVLGTPGTRAELHFMDGPFLVRVAHEAGDGLRLTPCGGRGRSEATYLCDAGAVRRELMAAAETVLAFCKRHGVENRDARVLQSGVEALRDAAR